MSITDVENRLIAHAYRNNGFLHEHQPSEWGRDEKQAADNLAARRALEPDPEFPGRTWRVNVLMAPFEPCPGCGQCPACTY